MPRIFLAILLALAGTATPAMAQLVCHTKRVCTSEPRTIRQPIQQRVCQRLFKPEKGFYDDCEYRTTYQVQTVPGHRCTSVRVCDYPGGSPGIYRY